MQLAKLSEVLTASAILCVLAVMIVPVPTMVIDFLLVTNIALALILLLVTLYVGQPLQFSSFPTLLLFTTLMRLSLNVASTRAILLNGYGGEVISAFGSFVVGGNPAVGLVAFFILAIIQFVVITKGAGRIAEVAARFTLDAMPGRQMAIDADLNAGIIDDIEAKNRREEITKLADFYGAMDGASKFVRGDSIAGVIITIINIIGGFAIGMLQLGMSLPEAVATFTLLTVGDGLVAQIPALVISTASGILITRVQDESNLAGQIGAELAASPRVFNVASGALGVLALVPGLPFLPFAGLSAVVFGAGRLVRAGAKSRADDEAQAAKEEKRDEPARVETLLKVDTMEIELGYGLIPLVDGGEGGDLLHRVTLVRQQTATELGIVVPPVRIRDNVRLKPDSYSVLIRGVEVASGRILMKHWLAMNPGNVKTKVKGFQTTDPVFGLPSIWVTEETRSEAELAGYTVVPPAAVIATHLSEVVKRHASDLLGRQETQSLVDNVKSEYSVVIEELIPGTLPLGTVQKVLQRLLRERVSIRDLGTILETLADHATATKSALLLTEKVRQSLGRWIAKQYVDSRGTLQAITLDLELERQLLSSVINDDGEPRLVLQPDATQKLLDRAAESVKVCLAVSEHAVFVCTQGARPHFAELIARVFPQVVVLSYQEVEGVESIRSVATLRLNDASEEVLVGDGG